LIDKLGRKWFGTSNGLSMLDGNTWTNYASANGVALTWIYHLAEDANGNIWIPNPNGNGFAKFDGINWTNITKRGNYNIGYVQALVFDQNNNLWFSTSSALTRYDGTNWIDYKPTNTVGYYGAAT
jgi:ligand-binding sensor domain-containing protein